MLKILNSPIYASIQNLGRFNHSHLGISVSGVMDEYAYLIANMLLDNKRNTNIIEINFSNVSFEVMKNTSISITGAKCDFYVNDVKKNIWQTFNVKIGDILKIGKIIEGLRVYLCVKGGFDIQEEPWGLSNKKLLKNELLDFNENTTGFNKKLKEKFIPKYKDELELRVMLSYQENQFSKEAKEKFFSSIYTVSNEISRMGYKLNGNPIFSEIEGIISEGIAFGSIQIPKDGQPIILLKDRQTIGGYPKIGVVLDVDCFKLAQAKPNTKINFKQISINEGIKISKKFYTQLEPQF